MDSTILVLGAGAVGTAVAYQLARSSYISKVILGDVTGQRAEAAAKKAKSKKVIANQIDAADHSKISKWMSEVDIIVNTSLPKFNLPLMRGALEKNVQYVDLASESGYEKQLEQDTVWRKAGLTAILGMGEDPGLSNVLARYAADKLDSVNSIRIRDGETASSDRYPLICLFSPEVFLGEITEPAFYYDAGRFCRLGPFQGREAYPFPDPIGPVPVYYVAHEETKSLPGNIGKGVRYVDFKLAITDDTLPLLQTLSKLNLISREPISVGGTSLAPIDLLVRLVPNPSEISGSIRGYAALDVVVEGKKNNAAVTYTLGTYLSHHDAHKEYGCNATAFLTGTCAAMAAVLLVKKEIEQKGTITPELLEPKPLLQAVQKAGIRIRETVNTTSSVT